MISLFKSKNCELFSNCRCRLTSPPSGSRRSQQGFRPKIATVAKVLLFPADSAALGSLVNNVATDSWWGPRMPYTSSLTGQNASELASAYEAKSGNQWNANSNYSLFEVAKKALSAVSDPHDKAEVAHALHKVNYTGCPVRSISVRGPAPGVGIINPVGVQWKEGTQVPGRDEDRGQLAEQERPDRGRPPGDECLTGRPSRRTRARPA